MNSGFCSPALSQRALIIEQNAPTRLNDVSDLREAPQLPEQPVLCVFAELCRSDNFAVKFAGWSGVARFVPH
jgi:hypothetical protein